MQRLIKNTILKLLYPHSYSSEALVKHIIRQGGTVGKHTCIYAPHKHRIDVKNAKFLEIGDNCLIAEGVIILAHDYSYMVLTNVFHDIGRKRRITHIGNNVFIGMNAIILMGANIGDNVIIGAGSVVSGDVESNSVYAGNPAVKLCSLQEYHEKRQKDLVNSARIYASRVHKKEEMGPYRCLFEERDDFVAHLTSGKFHGLSEEAISQMKMPANRVTWEELK